MLDGQPETQKQDIENGLNVLEQTTYNQHVNYTN
jgi:hypothetical protein